MEAISNQQNYDHLTEGFFKFFTIEDKKSISNLKSLASKFSSEGVAQTNEYIAQIDAALKILCSKKYTKESIGNLINFVQKAVDTIEYFEKKIDKYEADEPLAIEFKKNVENITSKLHYAMDILETYADLAVADKEIKSGETLTFDEFFKRV